VEFELRVVLSSLSVPSKFIPLLALPLLRGLQVTDARYEEGGAVLTAFEQKMGGANLAVSA
jgi:hypothetical protein